MLKILSYIRAILLMPFIVVWTLVCSILVILFALIGMKPVSHSVCRFWAKVLLFMSGVELEIKGLEKLPRGGFLYVFNHTSHYDIPVIFVSSPNYPHFGAKSELFAIPFFGQAMKAMGALPIERKNRAKVIQIYREAEHRVTRGEVFALAPEGTRQPGGGTLGEFKSGPFFFAVNSHMPIVPIILAGCERVIKKHSILINWGKWKSRVAFEILDPVYPVGDSEDQVPELKNKVREAMLDSLQPYY